MTSSTNRARRRGFTPVAAIGLLAAVLATGLMAAPNMALAASSAADLPGLEVEDITSGADGRTVHTTRTVHADPVNEAAPGVDNDAAPVRPVTKVSKRFASMFTGNAAGPGRLVKVVVTFAEDQQVPRFPDYDQGKPATAPANLAAQARADGLVRDLAARREPGYRGVRADIEKLGGRVLDTYWLTKGVFAEIPLSAVPALASRSDVRYVEPDEAAVTPADNTERAARALLGTDPYFTSGRAGDRVAILDSGVQSNAFLMSNPSVLGTGTDFTTDHDPFLDKCDHGTKTAGVIAGNGNLGDAYRGISGIKINIYKILTDGGTKCEGAANSGVQGLQAAVRNLEKVIVGAFGSPETEDSSVSVNADAAFDAGAVVIIANGNSGPGAGTVTAPGNARKVLGIGAVDVETFARFPEQSEGPTGDGRFKPDLVAPTNVETASATNNLTAVYHKTSAATAHAGGAAAVLRNFVRGGATDVEPGHVYAGMILGGSNPGGVFDNVQGAGKLKLSPPPNANTIYQKFSMTSSNGSSIGVSFNVTVPSTTPSNCRFSGSLWWGERAGAHNDYDIQLIDPNGAVRAISASRTSVFELARVNAPLQTGTWKVKVFPHKAVIGSQKVYGAVSTCR
jgi:hypothetical protein